ncbi:MULTISPECIES: Uma2 family endonuclease [unclassified Nodularia (in: cyanobacteria)]|uniref:Uma2 family endonuclease n=1 Tax=unclassified Nodularia (in: cyanobacteria) TaxID=2656917 RepID=UPI0018811128|nr:MULTISPECIES: Uma2 family endonuclease [unclassified Nodularia (in: cyanobacteria)]MBE9201627.1 Uma2 family endonuclease [Nodularia sp. LEGE 06071]MCC2691905.1 Uma2 family endonuclease [Nodularia sp. LEGE 04288]
MSLSTAKRFTIDEYHRLAELSFFTEDDRVELIEGEIVQMVAKSTAHSVCETLLFRELIKLVADSALVRNQQPIIISQHSEPEPDLTIVRNVDDNYLSAHPQPSDILLVIEVADSSLKYDQEIKLPIYAKAAITNYWIFNLVDNYLECYSEPYQDFQDKFGYRCKLIFLPNETVNLSVFPDLVLDLSQVFPKK